MTDSSSQSETTAGPAHTSTVNQALFEKMPHRYLLSLALPRGGSAGINYGVHTPIRSDADREEAQRFARRVTGYDNLIVVGWSKYEE